jgi:hypothetical protein
MAQKLEYEIKGKSDVEQVTNRAKKSVDSLGESFKKAGKDITNRITGMFAATVLFDKALGFVSNTFREFGEIADKVDRSGISAEQFQRLAYAAQQSGVSVSALAKATRQLRVDMAEAAAGDAKKLALFQALGVSMDQMKSGDVSSVFLAISSALDGSANDAERLLISTAFFGDKIGNDILPLLNDYKKLSQDIANAPVVDAKTLKAIGDANDGMDRLKNTVMVLVANLVRAYDIYSSFVKKVSESVFTGIFNFADKILPGGFASSAASGLLKFSPQTALLVAAGADGSGRTDATPRSKDSNARTAAVLAAIKAGEEKKKEPEKSTSPTSASSVSGNVIGVGQNPVISAMQEQTEIAKQQLECLRVIATKGQPAGTAGDITNKGATPDTPATK